MVLYGSRWGMPHRLPSARARYSIGATVLDAKGLHCIVVLSGVLIRVPSAPTCALERGRVGAKAMTAKRKRARRQSLRHSIIRKRGIVSTPLRRALDMVVTPRLNGMLHWEAPTIAETLGKLTGGRVRQERARGWINETRRAPAWFVAVLVAELDRRIATLASIRAELVAYKPADRAERSRRQAILAREIMARGHGAIGKRMMAARLEARRREERERAAWTALGADNAPVKPAGAEAGQKTTPTNDR